MASLFYLERIRTLTLRLASEQRGNYAGELNYIDDLPAGLLESLRPTCCRPSSVGLYGLSSGQLAWTDSLVHWMRGLMSPIWDHFSRAQWSQIGLIERSTTAGGVP